MMHQKEVPKNKSDRLLKINVTVVVIRIHLCLRPGDDVVATSCVEKSKFGSLLSSPRHG